MITSRVINTIIVLFECIAFYKSFSVRKWKILIFYTQISNLIALLASLLFVILGAVPFVESLRYTTTCMLIMTFLVTALYLVPITKDLKGLMLSGSGLYHHLLCPVLSAVSYFVFEVKAPHGAVYAPAVITLVYGLIMLYLNATGRVDGPYPFFRIKKIGVWSTVKWMAVLMIAISAISFAVMGSI